jgi:hypothetical protein
MRQLNRIEPAAGPEAFKTYGIRAPLSTHWRAASCAEVECEHYLNGWRTIVPADSPQAEYIRRRSGRKFTEERQPGGLTEFTFPAGQPCFQASAHRLRVEREERFLIRDGDHRGNPRGTPVRELRPDDWADDFANHQDKIATQFERG